MTVRAMMLVDQLRALYDRLPTIDCCGKCVASCGPIVMAGIEATQLEGHTGQRLGVVDDTMTCPLLKGGRCTVYEVRPLICRLYGVVWGMRCEHGCEPSRLLTDAAGSQFLADLEAIDSTIVCTLA